MSRRDALKRGAVALVGGGSGVDVAEARALVLFEAYDEGGVLGVLRVCDDPGSDRMGRLLLALRCIFEDLGGATTIDRRLAAALHGLAVYAEAHTLSGSMQGYRWRGGLVTEEVPALVLAVESIFEGAWRGLHAEPGAAADGGGR